MAGMLSDDDVALLRERVLAHLGTTMRDGSPHVTPMWVDTDGEALMLNTAKGRIKHRNIVRNPHVAVSINDPGDFYRTLIVRGTAELIDEGADDHIDMLARKYLGAETYPFRRPDETRVIVRVTPERVTHNR